MLLAAAQLFICAMRTSLSGSRLNWLVSYSNIYIFVRTHVHLKAWHMTPFTQRFLFDGKCSLVESAACSRLESRITLTETYLAQLLLHRRMPHVHAWGILHQQVDSLCGCSFSNQAA